MSSKRTSSLPLYMLAMCWFSSAACTAQHSTAQHELRQYRRYLEGWHPASSCTCGLRPGCPLAPPPTPPLDASGGGGGGGAALSSASARAARRSPPKCSRGRPFKSPARSVHSAGSRRSRHSARLGVPDVQVAGGLGREARHHLAPLCTLPPNVTAAGVCGQSRQRRQRLCARQQQLAPAPW